jgi:hypothetical protein
MGRRTEWLDRHPARRDNLPRIDRGGGRAGSFSLLSRVVLAFSFFASTLFTDG